MDDLIGRWVAGDASAAEEIYRRYYDRVRGFAVRLGENLVDAEDVAQEALIAGLEGLKAGRKPDRLTHWLLGIARHKSARRTRLKLETLDLPDPNREGQKTALVRRELGLVLDQNLQKLPPLYRETLELHHKEGLSRAEVAARLQVPIETVHARCERGYAKLREALSHHFTTLAFLPFAKVNLAAIQKLRPAFRDAVVARHLEGLSEGDAARKLDLPAATLRARLESAYQMLRCGASADWSEARASWRLMP